VPAATVAPTFAVIVTLPPPRGTLAEENCTAIPAGALVASVTLEVNPLPGVIFMVLVPDVPGASVTLAGDAASVNDDADTTATEMIAVPVKLPLVPVTVIEYNPGAAELLAATASVLVPDPGAEIVDGVNPTVTPAGKAPAFNTTAPLNPLAMALVNATGVLDPCCTVIAARFVVSVNAGAIVKLTVPADVTPPPVAVTVMVAVRAAAVAPTVMVNTPDPDPGAERLAGASTAVTPAGAPVTVSWTAFENPPATVIFAVDVPLAPCRTVSDGTDIDTFIDGGTVIAASPQYVTRLLAFTVPTPVVRS
jgi:hypothetical protein